MSTPTASKTQQGSGISGSYSTVWRPTGQAAPPSPYTTAAASNPVPLGSGLATGTVGVSYSQTITASGGTTPYTFAVSAGSLPTGLSLNSSTGLISGTPTTSGSSTFTITVTDARAHIGAQAFTITITVTASANFGFVA